MLWRHLWRRSIRASANAVPGGGYAPPRQLDEAHQETAHGEEKILIRRTTYFFDRDILCHRALWLCKLCWFSLFSRMILLWAGMHASGGAFDTKVVATKAWVQLVKRGSFEKAARLLRESKPKAAWQTLQVYNPFLKYLLHQDMVLWFPKLGEVTTVGDGAKDVLKEISREEILMIWPLSMRRWGLAKDEPMMRFLATRGGLLCGRIRWW